MQARSLFDRMIHSNIGYEHSAQIPQNTLRKCSTETQMQATKEGISIPTRDNMNIINNYTHCATVLPETLCI